MPIIFRKIEYDDLDKLHQLKIETEKYTHSIYMNNQDDQSDWYWNLGSSNKELAFIAVEDNEDVGFIYLGDIHRIHQNCTISYYIFPSFQGQKLGEKMLKAAVKMCFERLNFHRINAEVLANNPKSLHVMEKCGFVIEGIKKEAIFKGGKYIDSYVLGIVKQQNG